MHIDLLLWHGILKMRTVIYALILRPLSLKVTSTLLLYKLIPLSSTMYDASVFYIPYIGDSLLLWPWVYSRPAVFWYIHNYIALHRTGKSLFHFHFFTFSSTVPQRHFYQPDNTTWYNKSLTVQL